MLIEIRPQPYDPWQEISRYQERHVAAGSSGACAVFVGSMRDFNQGDQVSGMKLEHYEGMTEQQLTQLAVEAIDQHELIDVLLLHRIGEIRPNDPIVLLAAWSAHRAEAFNACREMMEMLKSKATFWKKETLTDSERWVDRNTPG
jgi:molybdopterin synthase catalytic subunit